MLDILVSVGQFLSVMGLIYGLVLSFANRDTTRLHPLRAAARRPNGHSRSGRHAARRHRAPLRVAAR